jgi:type I restriction enzyme M protein
VPACLLILRKQRPAKRRGCVLLIYAARHYRELSAQNELRPQDVMRMLVHYHAYGDAAKVPGLVAEHAERIRKQIDFREAEEVGRIEAEYQPQAERLEALQDQQSKAHKKVAVGAFAKLEKQIEKMAAKLAERDERIAEAKRRANDDRQDVAAVGNELIALYADPDELLKHARVVGFDEIKENEFNLNIPRYVDTFEPEPRLEVKDALKALRAAAAAARYAEDHLSKILGSIGYACTDTN